MTDTQQEQEAPTLEQLFSQYLLLINEAARVFEAQQQLTAAFGETMAESMALLEQLATEMDNRDKEITV